MEKERKEKKSESENEDELPKRKRGRPRKRVSFDPSIATVAVNDENESSGNNNREIEDDPATYEEAIRSEEKNEWLIAMNEELSAHERNNTWSVVDKDASMNVISTKWVFVKKRDENGVVKRFKARMVARGFNQQYGIDYTETFAPVIKMKSLRLIIALSSGNKHKKKISTVRCENCIFKCKCERRHICAVHQKA